MFIIACRTGIVVKIGVCNSEPRRQCELANQLHSLRVTWPGTCYTSKDALMWLRQLRPVHESAPKNAGLLNASAEWTELKENDCFNLSPRCMSVMYHTHRYPWRSNRREQEAQKTRVVQQYGWHIVQYVTEMFVRLNSFTVIDVYSCSRKLIYDIPISD